MTTTPCSVTWSGPQSPKTHLHPADVVVWAGERTAQGFAMAPPPEPPRLAFLGVRPCELAAIAVQDRVFLGAERDAVYGSRRDGAFLVAVNCTEPGGTCFCASMGTGPGAEAGFDIVLTEVLDKKDHYFAAEAGSERGAEVLAEAGAVEAKKAQVKAAADLVEAAAGHMGRTMETAGLADLLRQSLEHPHWQEVAKRCLTCANCTLVCPTCFCANVEDTTDLTGRHAERVRRWDSCFNYEFSLIHGGAASGQRRRPLPPVDDPQARLVVRPVRHVRAVWDAAGASPGARSASTSPPKPPPSGASRRWCDGRARCAR